MAYRRTCFHGAPWTQAIVGDLSRAEGALRTHLVHQAMCCPEDVREINGYGKAQKTRVKLREKGKLSLFIKRIVGVEGIIQAK